MGATVFLFVTATKIYQFKVKYYEIKNIPCIWETNISNDFTAINMEKTRLNGYVYEVFVDYNIIDTSNIIDIHKYFIKNMI